MRGTGEGRRLDELLFQSRNGQSTNGDGFNAFFFVIIASVINPSCNILRVAGDGAIEMDTCEEAYLYMYFLSGSLPRSWWQLVEKNH
jgi:hypothetical protein